ncbi:MAG: serine/threonine-protein kinase [Gemmataceae bacterium]
MNAPKVPGYLLLQRLGGGPITSVFEARDEETGAACAVKVLRDDLDDRATAVKLMQREARAGLALRHPHLVRLTEAHVLSEPHFLVMDLLPGESLRTRIRREYRLPVADALWITRQTAEALAAMHAAGFLHGDVKPDNVRLLSAGGVVLTDLGFAHRPGENAAFLRDGYLLGTVNYLAPEQCDEWPVEEYATDLFSLGVTLFEMLTGTLPYPAGTLREAIRRLRSEAPEDIRDVRDDLPPELSLLVGQLLEREPEDRPRASAVVHRLVRLEILAMARRRAA